MRYALSIAYLLFLWIADVIFPTINTGSFLNIALILSIGLLHGSNDLTSYALISRSDHYTQVAINYAIATVVTLVAYVVSPLLCLLGFVALSSFHFGEELLLRERHIPHPDTKFKFLTGLTVFALLFTLNYAEFDIAINTLTGVSLSAPLIITFLATAVLLLVGYTIYWNKRFTSLQDGNWSLLCVMAYLGIVFVLSDLLTSFTIFFVFWHSWPSLHHQSLLQYKSRRISVLRFSMDALPIFLFSLIGLLLIYFLVDNVTLLLEILLIAAIIITSPHIFVVNKLYGSKNL